MHRMFLLIGVLAIAAGWATWAGIIPLDSAYLQRFAVIAGSAGGGFLVVLSLLAMMTERTVKKADAERADREDRLSDIQRGEVVEMRPPAKQAPAPAPSAEPVEPDDIEDLEDGEDVEDADEPEEWTADEDDDDDDEVDEIAGAAPDDDLETDLGDESDEDALAIPRPGAISGAAGAVAAPASDAAEADITAFAPPCVKPKGQVLIQVFAHPPDAREEAERTARLADGEAVARPTVSTHDPIPIGAALEVRLDAPGLEVDEPVQTLTWRGETTAAYFPVTVRADAGSGPIVVRARVLIDGVLRRLAAFTLAISDDTDADAEPTGTSAAPYRSAFLSYAEEDRARVMEHYQALKAVGVEVFQDVLDLEPGERWARSLNTHINRSDVFLLYWSKAAAASEWVRREAEWALRAQRTNPGSGPDIVPVLLEGPPAPEPPDALAAIHFNDPVRAIIAAYTDA